MFIDEVGWAAVPVGDQQQHQRWVIAEATATSQSHSRVVQAMRPGRRQERSRSQLDSDAATSCQQAILTIVVALLVVANWLLGSSLTKRWPDVRPPDSGTQHRSGPRH
jgi:hypothetical protein